MQSVQLLQSLQFLQFVLFWVLVRVISEVDVDVSDESTQPILIDRGNVRQKIRYIEAGEKELQKGWRLGIRMSCSRVIRVVVTSSHAG
jgi:hypothetical protein